LFLLHKPHFAEAAAACEEYSNGDETEQEPVKYYGAKGHLGGQFYEDADETEQDGGGGDLGVAFEMWGKHVKL